MALLLSLSSAYTLSTTNSLMSFWEGNSNMASVNIASHNAVSYTHLIKSVFSEFIMLWQMITLVTVSYTHLGVTFVFWSLDDIMNKEWLIGKVTHLKPDITIGNIWF